MKTLFAAVAASASLAAVSTAGATARATGLYGLVTRSPAMPVCISDLPCSVPAKNVTLVFTRNGRVAARTTTNERGRYVVRLAPGSYAVRTATRPALGGGLKPRTVRVAGVLRLGRIDFSIDTGIR